MEEIRLALITGNEGKYKEISSIAAPKGIEVDMHDLSPPEIQADNLADVARFCLEYLIMTGNVRVSEEDKAIYVKGRPYKAVCVEDSGLFITALNGFPGVYSSYVFKTIGNEGIIKLMEGMDDRGAEFHAIIAVLVITKGGYKIEYMHGAVNGTIAHEPRGTHGFGYDPIFIPDGYKRTFAEDPNMKNELSHRARATEALIDYVKLLPY